MRCLCCNQPLQTSDSTNWHFRCIKIFFGETEIPTLTLSKESLEPWAKNNIQAGITTTGVQKKMSLYLDLTNKPSRFTLLGYPAGYILKPQSSEYPSLPEFEHTTLLLANTCGIPTVPFGLLETSPGEVSFITKRIDRENVTKIPMEDFCQLSGRLTEDKYHSSIEQCGKIIKKYSSRPGVDLSDFFNRILFCFLTGNADMHLKNFSLYRPKDTWILAPAYDLLPTNLILKEDLEESALTINGKRSKLQAKDFLALARSLSLSEKVANNLILRLINLTPQMNTIIQNSFLTQDQKELFTALVTARTKRLLV